MSSSKSSSQAEAQSKAQPVAENALPNIEESIQQKPLFIQPKLTIGSPDDPYEKEADSVANSIMRMPQHSFEIQRKCAACENEEEKIQRKTFEITPFIQRSSADGGGVANDSISNQINGMRGGGNQMDESTKGFMETRFGNDFSGVRIHTDSNAIQLSNNLNAQAFTVGNDIFFNQGKYQPDSDSGKQLLAHELTHTIQQSGKIDKKIDATIQRSMSFGPSKRPSGTAIHSKVLPLFIKHNSDLFIEAPIPGANKEWLEQDKKGRADFYKTAEKKGSFHTIGLTFDGEQFKNLSGTGIKFGGGDYNHNSNSAPRVKGKGQSIVKIDEAPKIIALGDLKPGYSSEGFLGSGNQLPNYSKGITNTANELNKYLDLNPSNGSPSKSRWNPTVSTINSLEIPPELVYPTGKGVIFSPDLAVYNGEYKSFPESGLKGALFVYKDDLSGIWSYEWLPFDASKKSGNETVNKVLQRLNSSVIENLTKTGPQISKKEKITSIKKKIQKTPQKFSSQAWKQQYYEPWKQDANKSLLSNKSEKDKIEIDSALVEVNKRTHGKLNLSSGLTESVDGYNKINHWNRFGGLYGWFREKFDFIYSKVAGFAKKIKDKVSKLVKKASSSSFGNWVKAAVKVIFKIFKMVGSWVVFQTLDKLIQSLQEGLTNNFKKLIESFTPDSVKQKIEEFEELKQKYEDIINEKEEELEKKLFGDKLELFEKFERFEAIGSTISDIVSLVKWGIRIIACASPPAIGCLWNLAIEALQFVFAKLIQTCWFSKEVYQPIISKVDLVKNFPAEIASKIVTVANEYIPVPKGFDPFFAPININYNEFKIDCDGGGDGDAKLTPERAEIIKIINEIGEEKFNSLLELMLKKGAGPWLLLTPERLSEIKDLMNNVSKEDLENATNTEDGDVPIKLDEFLKSIQSYNTKEKTTIKKFKESKAKSEGKSGSSLQGEGGVETSKVIYGKPNISSSKTTVVFAVVVISQEYESAKKDKSTLINSYISLAFLKENQNKSMVLSDIQLKYISENENEIIFENVKEFYSYYDEIAQVGFYFPVGKRIEVSKKLFKAIE